MFIANIDYGRRLLPQVVEDWASDEPQRVHSYVPVSDHAGYHFEPFTYSMLSHAVKATAQWLEQIFQNSKTTSRTVAFLGCSDILLLNVYTTPEAIRDFMESSECQTLIFVEETRAHVPDGCSAFLLGTLDEMLKTEIDSKYLREIGSFKDHRSNTIAVLQTSGSTGKPKSVPVTNGKLAVLDAYQSVALRKGCYISSSVNCHGSRCKYIALDLAYYGGVEYGIAGPIFEGTPIVLGPTQIVPHDLQASEFCDIMRMSKADSILAYPCVFERIVNHQQAYIQLLSLVHTTFLGGPLDTSTMRKIATQCPLNQMLGSTETGGLITYDLDFEDTASGYLALDSKVNGITWEEVEEGLFEPVLVRKPDLAHFQAIFHSFPDRETWSMGDLYSKHPDPWKLDVWKFERRRDDGMTLSSGENVSGKIWETTLRALPFVEEVIMMGQGRSEIGAIIQIADSEPKRDGSGGSCSTQSEQDQHIKVWALLSEKNANLGKLQKLYRSRIVFATTNKPMARTAKGGISRKKTLDLYAQEIEEMYALPVIL